MTIRPLYVVFIPLMKPAIGTPDFQPEHELASQCAFDGMVPYSRVAQITTEITREKSIYDGGPGELRWVVNVFEETNKCL